MMAHALLGRSGLTAGLLSVTLALITGIATAIRRYSKRANVYPLSSLYIQIAAVATIALVIYLQVSKATDNLLNDHRLAPTAAMLRGYPVYFPPEQGPALSTIYGPVMVWLHIPAALLSNPTRAVQVGTATNILIYYLPAIFLLWVAGRSRFSHQLFELSLVMFVFTRMNETLNSASSMIHADAPAIGFGVIACSFILLSIDSRSWRHIIFAGIASALSVLSKQNMAPLLPVAAIYVLLVLGWRKAIVYTLATTASLAVLLAMTVKWLGGLDAIVYNLLYIPSHQPYRIAQLIPAIGQLADLSFLFCLLAVTGLILHWADSEGNFIERLRSNPSLFFLIVGLALCSTSIMGKIKVVGSINTYSPSVYFFLMAGLLELQRVTIPGISLNTTNTIRRAIVSTVLIFFVVAQLPVRLYQLIAPPAPDAMARVYEFSKKHPGEVYFPQFPLSVLLGEGHLYHFSWGLNDRAEAGKPLSGEYFHRHIPPTAKAAGLVDWVWDEQIYRYLGDETPLPESGELEGFKFYKIRDVPTDLPNKQEASPTEP